MSTAVCDYGGLEWGPETYVGFIMNFKGHRGNAERLLNDSKGADLIMWSHQQATLQYSQTLHVESPLSSESNFFN